MNSLCHEQFDDFFRALYDHPPYSWQTRLAARAVEGDWPEAIDLPTGSGKTACIDIAIFALACQAARKLAERTAPRRIFFCVNRRVIVDEAYERARRIAEKLWDAEKNQVSPSPVLGTVAAALRQIAGTTGQDDTPPLDVLELRGGIYRDNRWARSAAQPTVVCTTVDQLGSWLLFRGYGVSPNAAPIQAALVAYDSLVLLDEAHISRPFLETLGNVSRYLDADRWADEPIGTHAMIVVPMTATPSHNDAPNAVIRLDDADRRNKSLDRRLGAAKRASLLQVADVSKAIVAHAGKAAEAGPVAIGIIVNRVATAKEIDHALREKHPHTDVELVIGAMRPVDRDVQAERLASRVGHTRPPVGDKTSFIVATQCLEVGADYDFDVLLTECASLDALRQRFGRLNRAGRAIDAHAVIVVNKRDVKPEEALNRDKPLDPIYGNALARTWNWLWDRANLEAPTETRRTAAVRTIDLGIDAFQALLSKAPEDGRIPVALLAPSAAMHAPVMLPSYVDFWCQTSPIPVPDPDIALFLHGPQHRAPDVQVCWRADLIEDDFMNRDHWRAVVALLPPTAAECMSVPIARVRQWLAHVEDQAPDLGDLLEVAIQDGEDPDGRDQSRTKRPAARPGVLWREAGQSTFIRLPDDLRPGDTVVLPVADGGWKELGHIPETATRIEATAEGLRPVELPAIDVAEGAFESARDKYVLRLHRSALNPLRHSEGINALLVHIFDSEDPPSHNEMRRLMREAADGLSDDDEPVRKRLTYFAKNGFVGKPYPNGCGIVLTARTRTRTNQWFLSSLDDGDDDPSRVGREVSLAEHTSDVVIAVAQSLQSVPIRVGHDAFRAAAERHDWGKADERFQALLRGTDRTDACLFAAHAPVLLAKSSDGAPQTPQERNAARVRSGLPAGFRHELLSVQLAERAGALERVAAEHDLILHLIEAHHGYCRPFAPIVLDLDPPDVECAGYTLAAAERRNQPPHRLDAGVADRFWSLTRRYGWWGLAYLEALLRLADQQASAKEDTVERDNLATPELAEDDG